MFDMEDNVLSIRLEGSVGGEALTPASLDLQVLRRVLEATESVLSPGGKRDRGSETIGLSGIRAGSAVLEIIAPAPRIEATVSALDAASRDWGVQPLPRRFERGIAKLQKLSRREGIEIKFEREAGAAPLLHISPSSGFQLESPLDDAREVLLYGTVIDIGGDRSPSIELDTHEYGRLKLKASAELLREPRENIIFRERAVRARGAYAAAEETWRSLEMLGWETYEPLTDTAIDQWLARDVRSGWEGLDADAILNELRN